MLCASEYFGLREEQGRNQSMKGYSFDFEDPEKPDIRPATPVLAEYIDFEQREEKADIEPH